METKDESMEAVLADLRRWGKCHFARSAKVRHFCDRLEAALKRECGDCAKLREALKLCVDEMCNRCRDLASARGNPLSCLNGCEPVRKAKAALAAPPRACDIMPEENLVKVVSSGIMQSITSRPEFNFDGLKTLVEVVAASAIKCAYDTQLISKGATDGSK